MLSDNGLFKITYVGFRAIQDQGESNLPTVEACITGRLRNSAEDAPSMARMAQERSCFQQVHFGLLLYLMMQVKNDESDAALLFG